MRRHLHICCLAAALAMTSCGDDGGVAVGGATSATSTLCEGLGGGEAILWDLYNGVPRVDPVLPPPIPSPNVAYGHPSFPMLGFFHPAGWTSQTIDGGIHDLGVNIVRADGTAMWRQQTTTATQIPAPRDVRDAEIDAWVDFLGLPRQNVESVCVNEATFDAGGGIPVSVSNILLRVDGQTIVVTASVTALAGTGTASVRRQVVAAPTVEFPARAYDTFLAIDFQMLVGDSRNLFDRDGDGWRDGVDAAPDDPTRH